MVMTDPGLTGVLDGDESPTDTAEDLLSAHEVVPKQAKAEPETGALPVLRQDVQGGRVRARPPGEPHQAHPPGQGPAQEDPACQTQAEAPEVGGAGQGRARAEGQGAQARGRESVLTS